MRDELFSRYDAKDPWHVLQWLREQERAVLAQMEEDFYYGADPSEYHEEFDRYAYRFDYGTGVGRQRKPNRRDLSIASERPYALA